MNVKTNDVYSKKMKDRPSKRGRSFEMGESILQPKKNRAVIINSAKKEKREKRTVFTGLHIKYTR